MEYIVNEGNVRSEFICYVRDRMEYAERSLNCKDCQFATGVTKDSTNTRGECHFYHSVSFSVSLTVGRCTHFTPIINPDISGLTERTPGA